MMEMYTVKNWKSKKYYISVILTDLKSRSSQEQLVNFSQKSEEKLVTRFGQTLPSIKREKTKYFTK